jgi:thiamine-monophosphate kinase
MERELVRWLKHRFPVQGIVDVGIGDDAAVIDVGGARLVCSTDTICDLVHFRWGADSPEAIGHKALAVNLSDMAAMGAQPLAALVALSLPRSMELADVQRIYEGMSALAARHGVEIVGGDTNAWDDHLMINVTVLGRAPARGCWRLGGGQAVDSIVVSGSLGGSLRGKHLAFEPQCPLARWLGERYDIHAATDISDSLTFDLHKLASASGCGAVLTIDAIPVSDDAHAEAQAGAAERTALEHALYDGEDFELLLAVDPDTARRMIADATCPVRLTEIGTLDSAEGLWQVDRDGRRQPLAVKGYEHQFGKRN